MRGLSAVAAGLIFTSILFIAGVTGALDRIFYDISARTGAKGLKQESAAVELVYVDQYSLDWAEENLGLSWPWPREVYALMAEFFSLAKVQVFDILYTEASSYGPLDDERFALALDSAGNAVVATASDGAVGATLFSGKNVGYGSARGIADSDGLVRRYEVGRVVTSGYLPSLGQAAVMRGEGTTLRPIKDEQVYLRYYGEFPSLPARNAAEILSAALEWKRGEGSSGAQKPIPEDYTGKYVFIGFSAPGLLDRQAVPTDEAMPGAEIHATFVQNYLDGTLLRPLKPQASWGVAGLLALVASYLTLRLKRPLFLTAAFVLLACIPLLSGFLLYSAGFVAPSAFWFIAGLSTFIAGIVVAYIDEGRNRAFLRRSFGHYLAPSVVDAIVENPSLLKLGGEEKIITVFFSDIQGFTSLSEHMSPLQLSSFMNTYLSLVSEILLKEGATIDKFIGDAVVAFWNAPLDQPDHALRAVRAGLLCREAFIQESARFLELSAPVPKTRIGIHTGTAVVGNMGSPSRFNYTALGDVVNTASRLENANKATSTDILVSVDTVKACCAVMDGTCFSLTIQDGQIGGIKFRRLGDIAVAGKKSSIEVWEPRFEGKEYSAILPWQNCKDCTDA